MGSQFHLKTYKREFAIAGICIAFGSFLPARITTFEPHSGEIKTGIVKRNFHLSYAKGGRVEMFAVEFANGVSVDMRSPGLERSPHVIRIAIGEPVCVAIQTGLWSGNVEATPEPLNACDG